MQTRKRVISCLALALSFYSAASFASTSAAPGATSNPATHPNGCQGDDCTVPTRPVCFNIECNFQSDDRDSHDGYKDCDVAATFTKDVTLDGGEVADNSTLANAPVFEVKCDGKTLYGPAGSHRFTGLLGTIIQGDSGPNPAISFPRGELHDANHVTDADFQIEKEGDIWRTHGSCSIWVGPA